MFCNKHGYSLIILKRWVEWTRWRTLELRIFCLNWRTFCQCHTRSVVFPPALVEFPAIWCSAKSCRLLLLLMPVMVGIYDFEKPVQKILFLICKVNSNCLIRLKMVNEHICFLQFTFVFPIHAGLFLHCHLISRKLPPPFSLFDCS
jgi:hypothetical protein